MLRRAAALLALFIAAAPARAAGPNGGTVVVSEGHPIEFVASDAALTFFVTDDDGAPARTVGLSAKAFVQAEGRTETVALSGAAPNRLVGPLERPLPAGARVVFSARVFGHALQARFVK